MAGPGQVPRLGYRPALDGIRALAVLCVMAWHFVLPGLKGGFLGVDVFFVLSGFLITSLLVEEWTATGTIHLGRFYMRRALRLFPALLLVLLASAAFVPRLWTLEALFYVANWGVTLGQFGVSPIRHLWSLSVEEQFYIVWPLMLVGLLRSRARPAVLYTVVALLALASAAFKMVTWTSPASWVRLFHGSDARSDALWIGCGLGLLLSWSPLPRTSWFRTAVRLTAIPAMLGLGYLLMNAAVYWEFLYHRAGLTLVAIMVGVLILQIMTAPFRWMTRLLEWRPIVTTGRISYGLYLWHVPVGWFTDPRNFDFVPVIPRVPLFLVRVALTFAIAALSYNLVERPMLKLKHRFASDR